MIRRCLTLYVSALMMVATHAAAQPDSSSDKLLSDQWLTSAPTADWLTEDIMRSMFPDATSFGGLEGDPPAVEILADEVPVGYMFLTKDITESVGFASTIFTIASAPHVRT